MKNWLLKSSIALLTASFLTGCVGLSPNQSSDNLAVHARPVAQHHYVTSRANHQKSNPTAISLNDFSNLNLNNYQATNGNLWDQIKSGFQFTHDEDRPEVQAQIRWFMAHPGYLQRTTERARPYLYIVYQEVKSRGLPTELALLPINESGYYPFSYSVNGATGIWQLMPGTASTFGLKKDFWYDGRRDIFDSTNAALDYLTYLANYFNNDWLLAIAAYNTGEGNVQYAVARNQRAGLPVDFWSLHLSAQTESYVPRLLALAAIVAHPERYPSISLPPVDAKPVVASVHIDKQINLSEAANLAGISVNQLKVLNPGLSRSTTDPTGNSKLLLPIDSIENFKQKLSSVAPIPQSSNTFGHYRVQRGDSLRSIANRFGITENDLREANDLLGHSVTVGKVLLIPNVTENYQPSTNINLDQASLSLSAQDDSGANNTATNRADDKSEALAKATEVKEAAAVPEKRHGIKHTIKHGESLSSIARQYHVSVSQLEHLNPGITHHPLKLGQVINVDETDQPIETKEATAEPEASHNQHILKASTAHKEVTAHHVASSANHAKQHTKPAAPTTNKKLPKPAKPDKKLPHPKKPIHKKPTANH